MNKVDELLKEPFSRLKLEDKLKVKELGPHQPKDFKLSQLDQKKNRSFSNQWFDKKSWLTVSEEKKSLFCFYCLLFGGESLWTKSGCNDLKHLSERIMKHEKSTKHMDNSVSYKLFGSTNILSQLNDGYRVSIMRHNELVDKNRHVLKIIIETIIFCGVHELALRGHDETYDSYNRGIFLDMLTEKAKLDCILEDHLANATVTKYTSKTIQNELLDCMYSIYLNEIKNDIENVNFVSVQADETTDITCVSQFVILLRYVKNNRPVERFSAFVKVNDRTSNGLFLVLKEHLKMYKIEEKLVSQAYDGAAVMSGCKNGVHVRMKDVFPNAIYVHCYAHQLNLILKKVCSTISEIRMFFATISKFGSFFSISPKRSDILRQFCGSRIPSVPDTRWNFYIRTVTSVLENKEQLLRCFERIKTDENMDDHSISEAHGLGNWLHDTNFNFLLSFFYDVLKHVDVLYNIIQARNSTGINITRALEKFEEVIINIREDMSNYIPEDLPDDEMYVRFRKRAKKDSRTIEHDAKEACDVIITQIKERFKNSHIFPSFIIADPNKFQFHNDVFPEEDLDNISTQYSMLNKEQLKREMNVIYKNTTFRSINSTCDLLAFFNDNGLVDTFPEFSKLLEIILATPVTTAESERCFSTLKRIKTFLRNSIMQERLNALAILSIHKDLVQIIPQFTNKVIDLFAMQKERRGQFLYK